MSMKKEKLVIFDTTLRDGEQSPGASMTGSEKLRIAKILEKLNVDVIEAGFPIASKGDFDAVSDIAKIITLVSLQLHWVWIICFKLCTSCSLRCSHFFLFSDFI